VSRFAAVSSVVFLLGVLDRRSMEEASSAAACASSFAIWSTPRQCVCLPSASPSYVGWPGKARASCHLGVASICACLGPAPPPRGLALWLRGLRGGCSVRAAFSTAILFTGLHRLHDSTTREGGIMSLG
jgi:hypothetical protein